MPPRLRPAAAVVRRGVLRRPAGAPAREKPSLSSSAEIMKAGRQANEEQKVLQRASVRDSQEKGKSSWVDWRSKQEKGEKGGKQEKGKKGKGDGKKKAQ